MFQEAPKIESTSVKLNLTVEEARLLARKLMVDSEEINTNQQHPLHGLLKELTFCFNGELRFSTTTTSENTGEVCYRPLS